MANPNEMKKIILSMNFSDITRDFIENNFCKFIDKKTNQEVAPKYSFQDKIILEANEFHNKTKIETTLGRLLTNKFLFEDGLFGVVGYVNTPISKKGLEVIEKSISLAVLDGVITTSDLLRYYDRVQWLGLSIHSSVCSSFSERTIGPLPEVLKLKEALFKKYEKDLQGPNRAIFAVRIEEMLLEEAKKLLANDDGLEIYDCGARGSFGNNYKNMMIIRGPVYNNVSKRFDILKASFTEGIKKEEIASYGSQVTSGAYPKCFGA